MLLSSAEVHRQLPMPDYMFGVVAFVFFMAVLALVWSFRGTAQKIAERSAHHGDPVHVEHGGAHLRGGDRTHN